jgi:cytochrome c
MLGARLAKVKGSVYAEEIDIIGVRTAGSRNCRCSGDIGRVSVCRLGFAYAAQEAAGAEQVAFNNHCRTCHSPKPDDNRLGPSLFGVFGRKAAGVQGYSYSDALKNSGLTWDEGKLDKFIADPEAVVPGNGMKPFTGVSNPQERAHIIAFLRMTH